MILAKHSTVGDKIPANNFLPEENKQNLLISEFWDLLLFFFSLVMGLIFTGMYGH